MTSVTVAPWPFAVAGIEYRLPAGLPDLRGLQKCSQVGAFAVEAQAEIEVFPLARPGMKLFQNVREHGIVLGECDLPAACVARNGPVHGAFDRRENLLIARGVGIGQQAEEETGLRPQLAVTLVAQFGREDAEIAVGVLRGEDVVHIVLRLLHGLRLAGQAREHEVAAVPVAFRLAVPPGVAGGIAGVGLAGPVAAGGEDVARRLMAQLVKAARETLLEVAAHLLENPAAGSDRAEPQRCERRLDDIGRSLQGCGVRRGRSYGANGDQRQQRYHVLVHDSNPFVGQCWGISPNSKPGWRKLSCSATFFHCRRRIRSSEGGSSSEAWSRGAGSVAKPVKV